MCKHLVGTAYKSVFSVDLGGLCNFSSPRGQGSQVRPGDALGSGGRGPEGFTDTGRKSGKNALIIAHVF